MKRNVIGPTESLLNRTGDAKPASLFSLGFKKQPATQERSGNLMSDNGNETPLPTRKPRRTQADGTLYPEKKPSVLHGDAAVSAVEAKEGPLTDAQKRVVRLEGLSGSGYDDTKGISTAGVGQTGEYKGKTFKETFDAHVARVKRRINNFDALPDFMKSELIQGEYRGDLGLSPTAVKHFNDGDYKKAGEEFLNHKEYKKYKKEGGGGNIPSRLEAIQKAMFKMAAAEKKSKST